VSPGQEGVRLQDLARMDVTETGARGEMLAWYRRRKKRTLAARPDTKGRRRPATRRPFGGPSMACRNGQQAHSELTER
jgi:hypothetical protein